MPKSKNNKSQKSRLAARNNEIKMRELKSKRSKDNFIMDLIKQEQEKGLFNNAPEGQEKKEYEDPTLSFDGDLLTMNDIK